MDEKERNAKNLARFKRIRALTTNHSVSVAGTKTSPKLKCTVGLTQSSREIGTIEGGIIVDKGQPRAIYNELTGLWTKGSKDELVEILETALVAEKAEAVTEAEIINEESFEGIADVVGGSILTFTNASTRTREIQNIDVGDSEILQDFNSKVSYEGFLPDGTQVTANDMLFNTLDYTPNNGDATRVLDMIRPLFSAEDFDVWAEFLGRILSGDFGTSADYMLIVHGVGGTGKSTLSDFVRKRLFTGLSQPLVLGSLLDSSNKFNEGVRPESLLNIAEETDITARTARMDKLKVLITHEEFEAQEKGHSSYTTRSKGLIMMNTNHDALSRVANNEALARRIRQVEMKLTDVAKTLHKALESVTQEEISALARVLIETHKQHDEEILARKDATQQKEARQYADDVSLIAEFLYTEILDAPNKINPAEVYYYEHDGVHYFNFKPIMNWFKSELYPITGAKLWAEIKGAGLAKVKDKYRLTGEKHPVSRIVLNMDRVAELAGDIDVSEGYVEDATAQFGYVDVVADEVANGDIEDTERLRMLELQAELNPTKSYVPMDLSDLYELPQYTTNSRAIKWGVESNNLLSEDDFKTAMLAITENGKTANPALNLHGSNIVIFDVDARPDLIEAFDKIDTVWYGRENAEGDGEHTSSRHYIFQTDARLPYVSLDGVDVITGYNYYGEPTNHIQSLKQGKQFHGDRVAMATEELFNKFLPEYVEAIQRHEAEQNAKETRGAYYGGFVDNITGLLQKYPLEAGDRNNNGYKIYKRIVSDGGEFEAQRLTMLHNALVESGMSNEEANILTRQ